MVDVDVGFDSNKGYGPQTNLYKTDGCGIVLGQQPYR